MRRIIFLDIDGVLTTPKGEEHWMKVRGDIFDRRGNQRFCPMAVEALNKITENTCADIVITSSWRKSIPIEEMRTIFQEQNVSGNIIDYTPVLKNSERGQEIKEWLNKHQPMPAYVVIDDDCEYDITEHIPEERCVTTDWTKGIADKSSYKRAINYLKRSDLSNTNQHSKLF